MRKSFFKIHYSNLSDSIGSDLAALYAGIKPNTTPTIVQIKNANPTTPKFIVAVNALSIKNVAIAASPTPITPPDTQIAIASIKN